MISRLRGAPVARIGERLVLDVGGVGYALAVTPTAARLAERELFEHLLAVSGVGPKVALAIVSGSPPADLRRAIALEDTARFEAIPGIGKKTAQRVVLELKEKVGGAEQASGGGSPHLVARDALVELGWSLPEAERALAQVDPKLSAEERVRLALRTAA